MEMAMETNLESGQSVQQQMRNEETQVLDQEQKTQDVKLVGVFDHIKIFQNPRFVKFLKFDMCWEIAAHVLGMMLRGVAGFGFSNNNLDCPQLSAIGYLSAATGWHLTNIILTTFFLVLLRVKREPQNRMRPGNSLLSLLVVLKIVVWGVIILILFSASTDPHVHYGWRETMLAFCVVHAAVAISYAGDFAYFSFRTPKIMNSATSTV